MLKDPNVLQYVIMAAWLCTAPITFAAVAFWISDFWAVVAVILTLVVVGPLFVKVRDKAIAAERERRANEQTD